jgi:hypothetical protein
MATRECERGRGEGVTVLGREGLERGLLPLFAFYVPFVLSF